MTDKVISLVDVRARRSADVAAQNTSRAALNGSALIDSMRYLCNRALNQGAVDMMGCLMASIYLTAETIARLDPGLDKPELRDAILRVLDRQVDEVLLQIWQDGGIPDVKDL